MNELVGTAIVSTEVAEMVGKEHKSLLRDIRKYCEYLAGSKIEPGGLAGDKIEPGGFFRSSTYIDKNNQSRPCFLVTKKGCEFIAHKLTGQKGAEFTARYINRFHEMEQGQETSTLPEQVPVGEVASYLKVMDKVAVRQQTAPFKIAEAFKMVSEQFGIRLPADFVKIPEYEQIRLPTEAR